MSFLALPFEIREQIYEHLLVTGQEICPFLRAGPRVLELHPNILQTCSTIFEEASPLLIQRNRYVFHSSNSLMGTGSQPVWNPDYSWQIMLHRYHSTILPLSARISPPRHRIRHLGLVFGSDSDDRLLQVSLRDHLNLNNMLKDLRIEIGSPWCVRALHEGIIGQLARWLGNFRVTLTAIHKDNTPERDRFFDHVEVVMAMWNNRQARKFVLTRSRRVEVRIWNEEPAWQEWSLEL